MTRTTHYPIASFIKLAASVLDVDATRITRRAGLSDSFLDSEGTGATTEQCLSIWLAIEAMNTRQDLALNLATRAAHGPFIPAMFAFSCSPNVETGLRRLAVFKPLAGPVRMVITEDAAGLTVATSHVTADLRVPPLFAVFEMLFVLESTRTYAGHPVIPLEIGLPDPSAMQPNDVSFTGVTPTYAPIPYIRFALEDAARPLITENSEAWPDFEAKMRAKLAAHDRGTPVTRRARASLITLLPSGEASIEALCNKLAMSKRSLQRHLKEEGQSFQSVLAATRSELALNYLASDDLSVDEISYLLAYREPNSFYRAFQGWTGMTPTEARGAQRA